MPCCLKVPVSKISKVSEPLPHTIPVSIGPYDTTRAPSQIVPFPTALQVSNAGGGGLSACAATGATPSRANAARVNGRTERHQVTRLDFLKRPPTKCIVP